MKSTKELEIMWGMTWGGWIRGATALGLGLGMAALSGADTTVVVNENPGSTVTIEGVTGATTFGDDMVGMEVTAFFFDGTSASATWGPNGAGAGIAIGDGFILSQSGDTFPISATDNWSLVNTRQDESGLTRILIDGIPGGTVFDRTFGGVFGTPGSAFGFDFASTYEIRGLDFTVTALYLDQVEVFGSLPVGDLFARLDIDLGISGGLLPSDPAFTFRADTDTVGPPSQVAEPGSLLLLGAGLLGIGHRRRR